MVFFAAMMKDYNPILVVYFLSSLFIFFQACFLYTIFPGLLLNF